MPLTSNSTSSDTISAISMLTTLAGAASESSAAPNSVGFVDRRTSFSDAGKNERRQFASSHADLSPDAREFALAIDRYKLERRRRYITCEEMLAIVRQLGYHRD